ncbi:GNAT family N-acetyltransferase [Knoellia sp. DB2414S]|uniref:GNAT family N-acetyltransferase n=1 Tax=Knoellia koreensis TaxID=2730921 RepID=A0A849HIX3_9MICO|nr:GNAT family N-acetyltransferase [Knoellia sp. DB2414S]NNM46603.1 GNAT family N-acetyltransferase [Knoellia sp. DB2414S]
MREELSSALTAPRLGPLVLATYLGGRGFVTYKNLEVDGQPADEGSVRGLVEETLAHYRAMPDIVRVEWKTRGHDHAPGLHEALVQNGFQPDEPESVMVGEARLLAYDVALPDGVVVREVTHDDEAVRRMLAMQAKVFNDTPEFAAEMEAQIFHRLRTRNDMEMWVAEADGEVVSAGRLEPVEGTEFAGVWGGATLPEWRGRGVYRALTSARARSAIGHGKKYMHSDSTEFSRPILERSGLVKVTTTTPYEWRRDRES